MKNEYVASLASGQGEKVSFAVDFSTSDFGRLAFVGTLVATGAMITLYGNFTARAIATSKSASMDSS